MSRYAFRIVNVFAEERLAGNPLCVFEDARGLDDATMQALALQFNLSETSFILPSDQASARVRIFTTGYEMRFAGHPTLGTAEVVRSVLGTGDALTLELNAGVIAVTANGLRWTLTAPGDGAPKMTMHGMAPADVAAMVGVSAEDLLEPPCWVDTGANQLLIPLRSIAAVQRAVPDAARFNTPSMASMSSRAAYLFAFDPDRRDRVVSRFFFDRGGGVAEDPGTGSACANLGGWLIATGKAVPAQFLLEQGAMVKRPCHLTLCVSADGVITVGGQVLELGRGSIDL